MENEIILTVVAGTIGLGALTYYLVREEIKGMRNYGELIEQVREEYPDVPGYGEAKYLYRFIDAEGDLGELGSRYLVIRGITDQAPAIYMIPEAGQPQLRSDLEFRTVGYSHHRLELADKDGNVLKTIYRDVPPMFR